MDEAGKVGEAVLHCPGCGEKVTVPVRVDRVSKSSARLRVVFLEAGMQHRCRPQ